MRFAGTWVLLSCLIAGTARADEPKKWTWDELRAEIDRNHPLVHAAKSGLDQLEAKLGQAEWAIFPSFNLQGGLTVTPKITGNALESKGDWSTIGLYGFLELTMVQPIWTFGKISEAKAAAHDGVAAGQAAVAIATNELNVRAAQAYYGRLLSLELDSILVEGKGWIDKAEQRMEKLRDEDSPKYDQNEHLRLRVRVSEFAQLQASNDLLVTQSTQGLRLLLRAATTGPVTLAETSLTPAECALREPDWYVEQARIHDPVVRAATSNARAQEHLAEWKDADMYPDIVLVGNAAFARATEIENQPSHFARDPFWRNTAGAALGLRWKLDLAQRKFIADEAHARASRARSELEVAEDLNELNVRSLVQDLANKKQLIEVFGKAQRTAQGWLTAQWDTYDAGFSDFDDVMDALVQFYQKKFGYLQLVFEHNLLIWKLNQAVGTDVCGAVSQTGDTPAATPR